MKKTTLFTLGLVLMGLAVLTSCTQKDPNEETNDLLNGTWEATSLKIDNVTELINGNITKNELVFQKDSIDGGLMSWDIVTDFVQLSGDWSGRYSISNSGTRLNFYDRTYIIDFEDDLLKLEEIGQDQNMKIEARMK
jgi:hypothetical protein